MKTEFWNDLWIGEESLATLFPNLFKIKVSANRTRAQSFRCGALSDGISCLEKRLMTGNRENHYSISVPKYLSRYFHSDDKPMWRLQRKGVSTVKSCYWSSNVGQTQNRIWP